MSVFTTTGQAAPPRLLDELSARARKHGHCEAAVAAFVDWTSRFIHFRGKRIRARWAPMRSGSFSSRSRRQKKTLCEPWPPVATPSTFSTAKCCTFNLATWCCHARRACWTRFARCFVSGTIRCVPRNATSSGSCVHSVSQQAPSARHGGGGGAQFFTDLAVNGHVAVSTQSQALNALVFLYKQVLEIDLGRFDAVRAHRPKRCRL